MAAKPKLLKLPKTYCRISGMTDALKGLRGLSDKARLTYALVANYETHGYPFQFAVRSVAGHLGCSMSTARAKIAELEAHGYIQREARYDPDKPRGRTSNRLVLLRDPAGQLLPGRVDNLAGSSPFVHTPSTEDQVDSSTENPAPKQQDLDAVRSEATTADVDKPVDDSSEIDDLRADLEHARSNEPAEVTEATKDRPIGPGLHKAAKASLKRETLEALVNLFGSDKVMALEQAFASARWRAPHVAEAGAVLLLKRSKKRFIRNPRNYVETLYAEAVELAQRADLGVPMPGVQEVPKPRGLPTDSLEELNAYRAWLHKRIALLEQTSPLLEEQGDYTSELGRRRQEIHVICRLILAKQLAVAS